MSETTINISPAKAINHGRLDQEIRMAVSNYSGAKLTYDGNDLANALIVNSPTTLSGGDTTTISGLITAHVNTPLPNISEPIRRQYHIKTTDATATAITSATSGNSNFVEDIPSHCIAHVEYLLIAVKVDETAYKKWHGEIALSRAGNGPTWPGPGTFDDYFVKTVGTITASRTGAISGNKPIVTVTGAASTTIQWSLYTTTFIYRL